MQKNYIEGHVYHSTAIVLVTCMCLCVLFMN